MYKSTHKRHAFCYEIALHLNEFCYAPIYLYYTITTHFSLNSLNDSEGVIACSGAIKTDRQQLKARLS